eukprot:CAMPEP_0176361550 /NCGR_PEP_ID=MMETSP0126-20121128/17822_1 /TAXON_ID=141414 ORGANISM="Strombidinopsis acuminatum, Strain SPMC142" /NCGR_SAMPLE_ID=MMETSP0126 /ASSEMBLY_ACC=CAM_ASM_000229 /LENGTH=40 /DNA_ID= /DNA_START= /DNA_END= /DNA_ORIENTATION=
MTSDNLLKLLDDEEVVKQLLPHMPEGQQDEKSLRDTLTSP